MINRHHHNPTLAGKLSLHFYCYNLLLIFPIIRIIVHLAFYIFHLVIGITIQREEQNGHCMVMASNLQEILIYHYQI